MREFNNCCSNFSPTTIHKFKCFDFGVNGKLHSFYSLVEGVIPNLILMHMLTAATSSRVAVGAWY